MLAHSDRSPWDAWYSLPCARAENDRIRHCKRTEAASNGRETDFTDTADGVHRPGDTVAGAPAVHNHRSPARSLGSGATTPVVLTARGSWPQPRSTSRTSPVTSGVDIPAWPDRLQPLVVRGVVYGLGANGMFVALDAATAKSSIHKGVQNFNGRGVNYWESKDGNDRRLIFSANNILQAIDAQTGQAIQSFGRRARRPPRGARPGSRDGEPAEPHPGPRLRGPDHSRLGDESGYASAPGDIRAFNVRTGALVWTFTSCRGQASSHDTWPPDAGRRSAAPTTGPSSQSMRNAASSTSRPEVPNTTSMEGNRHGANLFGDCLIALDVENRQAPLAFPDGPPRHLGPRQQFGSAVDDDPRRQDHRRRRHGQQDRLPLRLDRVTGQPIWPIEERPVPQGTSVLGEVLWPTQPFPTSPPPFSRQKFTADDLNPVIPTPEEREQFKQRISKARNTGRSRRLASKK